MDGIWHKAIFKRSKAGLNSSVSFSYTGCLTKAKKLILFYYLSIAFRKADSFIPFLTALAWSNTASFRVWTLPTDPISYDDNRYAKRCPLLVFIVWPSIEDG